MNVARFFCWTSRSMRRFFDHYNDADDDECDDVKDDDDEYGVI